MKGDSILDGGSVVTNMKRDMNPNELGIRRVLPESGWTQARSMAARTTPIPRHQSQPHVQILEKGQKP